MRKMILALLPIPFVLSLALPVLSAQPQGPFLVVRNGSGEMLGLVGVSAKAPDRPLESRGGLSTFLNRRDAKLPDGQFVSGVAFMAWRNTSDIVVTVYALVPPPGAPNAYVDSDRWATLRRRDLLSFTMRAGTTRSLDELKDLVSDTFAVTLADELPNK
jgi:hypothetical protein